MANGEAGVAPGASCQKDRLEHEIKDCWSHVESCRGCSLPKRLFGKPYQVLQPQPGSALGACGPARGSLPARQAEQGRSVRSQTF